MSGRGKGGKGLGAFFKASSVVQEEDTDWELEEEIRLVSGGVEAHNHKQDIVMSDDEPIVPKGYKRKKKEVDSDDEPVAPKGYKRKKKPSAPSQPPGGGAGKAPNKRPNKHPNMNLNLPKLK